MDKTDIIRIIAALIIIFVISLSIFKVYVFIKDNNISLAADGIRMAAERVEYPNTDNPIMEGVTVKEYNAIRR